jgi:hypothetical protein
LLVPVTKFKFTVDASDVGIVTALMEEHVDDVEEITKITKSDQSQNVSRIYKSEKLMD